MKTNQIVRFALGIAGLVLLVWFSWQVKSVFIYFAVSVVLALMGRPVMSKLAKVNFKERSVPDWASALVVMLAYMVLLGLFFKFLIPVLASQIDIIVNLDVELLLKEFNGPISDLEAWFQGMNINGMNRDAIQSQLAGYLNFSSVSNAFENVLSGLGSILVGLMSILFITFFLLKDKDIVNNIVDTLTPDRYLKSIHNILSDTKDLLTRYFIGVAIQVSIVTAVVSIGLSIFNVPNALLIGFMAGLINIIPYIGPLIGATFGISLSLLSHVHLGMDGNLMPLILKIISVFGVAQLTDNFVLQPLIFSKSVKAHPLEIFVVIMAAGMIAGVVGMILAVPTYTFLRIVAKEFFQGYKVVQGLTKDL
ncbi:MAG: putative PurR-regulated permease PerM [Bacteroidia bacterium]|jgi:predicted PurR-regulated permease PerM